MAKEPKAKEHSKKSKAKEYTKIWLEANTERSESNPGRSLGIKVWRGGLAGRQYQADKNQADKNQADKISIDKNKEKKQRKISFFIFIYWYFLYHNKQWNPQPRQRDFSLFTLHSSLFTKKTSRTVHANKKVRENAKIV